jgi:hypothetical protein
MSRKKSPYARIAVTLPNADLEIVDRLAKRQDRSRNWVIAEAIRRYASGGETGATPVVGREPAAILGIGPSRRAQVLADMALSPEERVRAAEETARVSYLRRPSLWKGVLAFDHYEDYVGWKRREDRGG